MAVNTYRSSKRLHHHAMPILIVTVALFVVSMALVLQQNSATGSGVALVHDLFTRPVQVTPSSDGFAHVTLNKNTNEHISPEIVQAGRTTELMFNLDSKN